MPRSVRPTGFKIYVRFARYLLYEFRWPIGVFSGLVLVCGIILKLFYHHPKHDPPLSYGEAFYAVYMLIFLEAYLEFPLPEQWYLEPLWFILPIVGLGAVADSVVRLAYLVFASKQKLPEWQRMLASMYRNHIVIVGVGRLGYRIVKGLVAMKEPIVAVERQKSSLFLDEVYDLGVPVIIGNGRNRKVLEEAGIRQARSLILATDDDLVNLDAALTARDLNPSIKLTVRLFDDTLATKFASAFQIPAISSAQVSAPAFIASATNRKVYHQFQLDGEHLHLIDITIQEKGLLAGQKVGPVQANLNVNVVMHRGADGVNVNPGHDVVLSAGDSLLVIGPIERLLEMETANRTPPAA